MECCAVRAGNCTDGSIVSTGSIRYNTLRDWSPGRSTVVIETCLARASVPIKNILLISDLPCSLPPSAVTEAVPVGGAPVSGQRATQAGVGTDQEFPTIVGNRPDAATSPPVLAEPNFLMSNVPQPPNERPTPADSPPSNDPLPQPKIWTLDSPERPRQPLSHPADGGGTSGPEMAVSPTVEPASPVEAVTRAPGMLFQTKGNADGTGMCVPFIGPQCREYLGCDPEEIYAHPEKLLAAIHPEDWPHYCTLALASMRNLTPFEIVMRIVSTTGQTRWVHVQSTPERLPDGGMLYSGMMLDVSMDGVPRQPWRKALDQMENWANARSQELDRPQAELKQQSAERQEVEKERDQLRSDLAHAARLGLMGEVAASIAHELGQPITVIQAYARGAQIRLQNSQNFAALDDQLREILDEILKIADRASQTIRRTRAFLQKRELELAPVSLSTIVQEATQCVQFHLQSAGIRLVTNSNHALPAIEADQIQLMQVLLNLLLNAVDAVTGLDVSRRQIAVEVSPLDSGWQAIAVRDSGSGIAPEHQPRIFERFFTTKVDGLGVGLSLSRAIIEQHGGRIRFETHPDVGTAFIVELPQIAPRR